MARQGPNVAVSDDVPNTTGSKYVLRGLELGKLLYQPWQAMVLPSAYCGDDCFT